MIPTFASTVLAPNPGPMTLEGTNTWLLRDPRQSNTVVVDPGPDDAEHLAAVAGRGAIALILLTHGHADHSAGIDGLHALSGAPVAAFDDGWSRNHVRLSDGDVLHEAGLTIEVLHTPGHSADSLSFVIEGPSGQRALITGDTVLGRGTTVVQHPEGRLSDYLASLARIEQLGDAVVLPGHGPAGSTAVAKATEYLAHRQLRLNQVRAAVTAGVTTPDAIVDAVYVDIDPAVRWAAVLTVQAQLEYLNDPRS